MKKHKRYGRAWKRIRDKYYSSHPVCELCGDPTQEIHHIKPLCEGGTHDVKNLMALCSECHYNIHEALKIIKYEKV